ncbi:LLM class flavin-dependent oxidoreductase [Ornithinimicrobium murale]|uniref:LLM class flavin-dependent oxidoreductase n=1 Tax=Ornithinimicrobium murale TaxID=1050153 RepID=UPI000E0D549F|nr:LLM class flavin-dependent oxidoreductase [Ornithinimicrobium murale]
MALPTIDPLESGIPPVRRSAQEAEALGFDGLWVGDHLFFHVPLLECLTTVGYALGATETLSVGTGVLLPALREPVSLARQLATLDVLSSGRLVIGVGVGGEFQPEWEAVNVDMRERGGRTDEFLSLWKRWCTGEPLTHDGRYWRLDTPPMRPLAPRENQAPVWIGGRSDASLARTVRMRAGWLGMLASPRRVTEVGEQLHALCAAEQVEPSPLGLIVFVNVGEPKKARAELAAYVSANFRTPFEKLERWMVYGTSQQVAEQLTAYVKAGLDTVVIHAAAAEPRSQMGAIREAVELAERAVAQGAEHA